MGRWSIVMLGLAASLAATSPGWAQGAGREDGRITFLRYNIVCQLEYGGFLELTKPEHSPSAADLALLNEITPLMPRIVYDGEDLARQVGPAAQKRLEGQTLVDWGMRLRLGEGRPDKAAVLRADLERGLRNCVDMGQRLVNPPPGWEP